MGCSFESCDRPERAVGLCQEHYRQQRAGKTLTPLRAYVRRGTECLLDYCDKPPAGLGYCQGHYRALRQGRELKPLIPRPRQTATECVIDGCLKKARRRNMCQAHEAQMGRFGVVTQGKACAICSSTSDLVVDHDHLCCTSSRTCGQCVRGILCRKCNAALGLFNDSAEALSRAIAYLNKEL